MTFLAIWIHYSGEWDTNDRFENHKIEGIVINLGIDNKELVEIIADH